MSKGAVLLRYGLWSGFGVAALDGRRAVRPRDQMGPAHDLRAAHAGSSAQDRLRSARRMTAHEPQNSPCFSICAEAAGVCGIPPCDRKSHAVWILARARTNLPSHSRMGPEMSESSCDIDRTCAV